MPTTLFRADAINALNAITPENNDEQVIKTRLLNLLGEPDGPDMPDILLCLVESDFDYPRDENGFEHRVPNAPRYQDGINFLNKYNLMP